MTLRRLFHWKTLFYDLLLPALRLLGPRGCDAALTLLGHAAALPHRRSRTSALIHARGALNADWDVTAARSGLAGNTAKAIARDYPLDGLADAEALARFDVSGLEHLETAMAGGKGVIVVGCHFGAYLAGIHWLHRQAVPIRLLVQRPGHVSRFLRSRFDRIDGPHPQSGFFLRRKMAPGDGATRLMRARAALRDGMAVYLSGDIPWPACHPKPGRLLGQSRPFQSAWAELAALTRSPVVRIFCRHLPGGRYALTLDPPSHPNPASAVPRYLERLEQEIAAHPSDALAHLTWPCYTEPEAQPEPPRRPADSPRDALSPMIGG